MADKKNWTVEQDRLLKYVFETSKLTKWSHIARKLQEDYGVRGRNGKQCKERYITHIDTSHPKEDWNYQEQQRMIDIHNELGNKWAIIGSKLNGRSDNCVKNHFYSLLRKALRKINKVINLQFRKQLKEFKPNVLYRIIEVVEEGFKLVPNFEKEFSESSNQLKKELIEFSYEDQIHGEDINVEIAKQLIDKIGEFAMNYKKKAKKEKGDGQDLLTPTRYQKPKRPISQNEESEGSSIYLSSASESSHMEDISDDEVSRSIKQAKMRKNSTESGKECLQIPEGRIRTRAKSHGSCLFVESANFSMNQQRRENEVKVEHGGNISSSLGIEGILDGLKIMEQQILPPHPLMLTKSSSRYSSHSEYQAEQYHFFEDSEIGMRIVPEMLELDLGIRMDVHHLFD